MPKKEKRDDIDRAPSPSVVYQVARELTDEELQEAIDDVRENGPQWVLETLLNERKFRDR